MRRRVTDMSRGSQQFRRKVLRMLNSWVDALDCRTGWNSDEATTNCMKHTVRRVKSAVEDLR